jgi:hypothetical protein
MSVLTLFRSRCLAVAAAEKGRQGDLWSSVVGFRFFGDGGFAREKNFIAT